MVGTWLGIGINPVIEYCMAECGSAGSGTRCKNLSYRQKELDQRKSPLHAGEEGRKVG